MHPTQDYISYGKLSSTYHALVSKLDSNTMELKTVHEALKFLKWKVAIQEEIKALEKNGTSKLTELPLGKTPVGCKWIFTPKYNPDGSVNQHKACLVAKDFTQSYGIDYQETFVPVVRYNTIWVLFSRVSNLDWPLYQLDVNNVFLNGDLEEDVYMEVLVGLKMNLQEVCKLKKALYGLKHSRRLSLIDLPGR